MHDACTRFPDRHNLIAGEIFDPTPWEDSREEIVCRCPVCCRPVYADDEAVRCEGWDGRAVVLHALCVDFVRMKVGAVLEMMGAQISYGSGREAALE